MADTGREGMVLVAEESGAFGGRSGRFSAHWESHAGRHVVLGPQHATLDRAVSWARAKADFVVVRLGESDAQYAAGRLPRLPALAGRDARPAEPARVG